MSRCKSCDKIMAAPVPLDGYCSQCDTIHYDTTRVFDEMKYDERKDPKKWGRSVKK